jgi:hypothetical protein
VDPDRKRIATVLTDCQRFHLFIVSSTRYTLSKTIVRIAIQRVDSIDDRWKRPQTGVFETVSSDT